ncbi:MAG: FAD-binding oxidoreductase [Chromatiales bacterium]
MNPYQAHAGKTERLLQQFTTGGLDLRLGKSSSNLFRDRRPAQGTRLDVRAFDSLLAVDTQQGWVDVEGMTPYDALTDATLAHQVMPAVVPQLKSITIGGAVAGVGIEATSFRQGLVHETLLELEVLVGDGRVITCTPDNEHSDLFFGFPNSYGSLGYALRLKARTLPVRPFVRVQRRQFSDPEGLFADLEASCDGEADFIDGVVFGPHEFYLNEARFVDAVPSVSDYSYRDIYYRSIRDKPVDHLRVRDYLWRWDTDWFWCSKNLGAQNPLLRRLYGPRRLNSRFYTRVMRWNSHWGLTRRLERLTGWHSESVIQDVEAAEFLDFFQREIGILPIWICPTRSPGPGTRFDLYPLEPDTLYVNFGFWDRVRSRQAHPPGHFNRLVEAEVAQLGGIKSLYSTSFYEPDAFRAIYGGETYRRLKAKYDPQGRFKDLYQKCVLRD